MSLTPQIKRYIARQIQGAGSGEVSSSGVITVSGSNAYIAIPGNFGIGTSSPSYKLDVDGGINITAGNVYRIAGTSVLSATALGSGVVSSALTSVGTITTGVWQGTAIADTYLATISTAGKVANSATTATSANTPNTIVLRDASGNFSAGTISAGALTSAGLITFASLKGTGAITVTNILDEDNMASDSATALATQQSIKAYVDAQVAGSDSLSEVLAIGNTTGANDIIVNVGQKIRTPAIAAQDGTASITIANSTGALTLNTALADTNLATISTAGKVSNSATTATTANTASTIVLRDGSGNFSAGTVTATFSGNLTGNVTGNVSGTAANVTGTVAIANGGTGTTAYVGYPRILLENGDDILLENSEYLLTESAGNNRVIVYNPVSNAFTTVSAGFPGQYLQYASGTVAWADVAYAVTSNALSSARTFAVTGDVTGSASSDLASGVSITTAIAAGVIVDADINASAAITDTKLATISTAGKVANSATTATSANTVSAIVARDGSGDFAAGTITAALSGNASTATTLQTARNINGVSFNGSADITVGAAAGTLTGSTLASGVTASSLTSVGTLAGLTVSGTATLTSSSGELIVGNGDTSASPSDRTIRGTDGSGTNIAGSTVTIRGGRGTGSGAGGSVVFQTSSAGASGTTLRTATERVRITPQGYFKATSDGSYYNVNGNYHELYANRSSDPMAYFTNSSNSDPRGLIALFPNAAPDNNTAYFLLCSDNVANRTFIYSDGDVWTSDAGTLTSDATLKRDITDATSKLADVMRLKVRNFYWTEDYHPEKQDKKLIGFIAQELEEVFPGLVSEHAVRGGKPIFEDRVVVGEDGTQRIEQVQVGETPKDMRKGLKEGKLIPILVKAFQEAVERIEVLEASNQSLAERVALLESVA